VTRGKRIEKQKLKGGGGLLFFTSGKENIGIRGRDKALLARGQETGGCVTVTGGQLKSPETDSTTSHRPVLRGKETTKKQVQPGDGNYRGKQHQKGVPRVSWGSMRRGGGGG